MAFKHAPASARPEVSIPVVGLMNEWKNEWKNEQTDERIKQEYHFNVLMSNI